MVFEIDQHNEFLSIFYEDSSTGRIIVVYASCIVDRVSSGADPDLLQPFNIFRFYLVDWLIRAVQLTQHFN
jgi:hypothetical protein